jgi:hypothetical protein
MRPQRSLKLLEAAPRHIGEKLVAVAKMPVRRCGTHVGPTSRLRKGKACWSFLRDQCQRGPDQRFFQIAMVIAAVARGPALLAPTHVTSFYMTRNCTSNPARGSALLLLRKSANDCS